jgi:2-pyrone-4,6-dicarboxylate lactonase
MDADYLPFHPNPSKPAFVPPPGAVDAHCHVFGPADTFPYAPERKYTPCDAPKEKLFELRDFLGFERNVIVQATCHGKDNRALVDALVAAGDKARGIASVGKDIGMDELNAMNEAGVRGVRFNFVKRLVDNTPKEVFLTIADKIGDSAGTSSSISRRRISRNCSVPQAAADHHRRRPHGPAGRDQGRRPPRFPAFCRRSWPKTTTSGRRSPAPNGSASRARAYDDVVPFARTLVEKFPDRVLWGTDWPHPNMKSHMPDDGKLVDFIPHIAVSAEAQKALLVDNPMRLYWP